MNPARTELILPIPILGAIYQGQTTPVEPFHLTELIAKYTDIIGFRVLRILNLPKKRGARGASDALEFTDLDARR